MGRKGGLGCFRFLLACSGDYNGFLGVQSSLPRLAFGNHVARLDSMAELYPTIAQCAIATTALKILLIPA